MKKIAVIFGGESVEHDVSILTGLQFLDALDAAKYEGFPVYVDTKGRWWAGEDLRERAFYPVTEAKRKKLTRLALPLEAVRGERPRLLAQKRGLLGRGGEIEFDLAVPAIHGTFGEDGTLQGLLEFLGIPYAGCPPLGAAAAMDKAFTKRFLEGLGIPVLPHLAVAKPPPGKRLDKKTLAKDLKRALGNTPFPVIVKPNGLGSSIGVTRAGNMDEVLAGLLLCFRLDYAAIVEPFVPNLAEYNVAVSRAAGSLRASVIERPLKASEFLAFRDKYLSGGDEGAKLKGGASEGMASLNRVLEPNELPARKKQQIRAWACEAFAALGLAGSVRVDFLCDTKKGRVWLNEINTIPGSFAFYLWQESKPRLSFTELAGALVEEGLARARERRRDTDRLVGGGIIFKDG